MPKVTQKSKLTLENILLISIYIIYFIFMAEILLFKNVRPSEIFGSDRDISRQLAIMPFQSIMKYYNSGNIWASILNVIGNIVVFIPFGIYLMLYTKKNTSVKATTTVFFTSLSVEVIQFVLDIGIADVDDIILNVIGGIVGVLGYKFLKLIFKQDKKVKTTLIFLVVVTILIYTGFLLYAASKGIKVKLL